MNWFDPENLPFFIQNVALLFFIASLTVFVVWVALPVHRLVAKLGAYAQSRGDVVSGAFKNDAEVLAHVFKLLTQDVQQKEKELQALYEQARNRARFMEHYSDRLVESIPVGLLGFDKSGRLISMNTMAEKFLMMHPSDALGQTPEVVFGGIPEVLHWVERSIREGQSLQGREVEWRLPNGEVLSAELSGALLPEGEGKEGGYVVVLFDRTPLRLLESQARMNDRLASLVDLSTGLAHQIRNPLSGVLGYTDLILKKSSGEVSELALSVREDALLLKKVVDDFLEFLRERQASEKPLFWRDVLGEVRRDIERELKARSVAIALETGGEDWAVRLDRGSAYQAAFNLVLNAVEASPTGGRVEVRFVPNLDRGEIALCVEDSGPGVADGLREKIFHPFFTTKPEGRGLGLAVVYRVAQAAHGRVEIGRSTLGGAKFSLILPGAAVAVGPSTLEGEAR